MARGSKSKKLPSRKRYEEKKPTISFRLDRETKNHLEEHLEGTGCSFADFIKDALGREESMVKKRIETLASRQADPSLEEKVRCVENLAHEIFSITVDTHEYPPYCPRCDNQELFRAEGRETESKLAQPWVPTWKCPKCGARLGKSHKFCPTCGHSVEKAVAQEKEHHRLRTLPVGGDTLEMLSDFIRRDKTRGLIFHINRHRAWQVVKECSERAGLPKLVNPETGKVHNVSPHRLRDAFAVHAVKLDDSGDGLRLLQEHLGHTSFNTTAKYRKVAGEEHREWYQRLWEKGKS